MWVNRGHCGNSQEFPLSQQTSAEHLVSWLRQCKGVAAVMGKMLGAGFLEGL